MDAILGVSRIERNPYHTPNYNFDLYLKRIVDTKKYNEMSIESQRKLIWLCFDFIVQLEDVSLASGNSSLILTVVFESQ
jgi:hypothetical protein